MDRSEWLNEAYHALMGGETVVVCPTGSSMKGRIEPGDLVKLVPVGRNSINVGDIVLARVRGSILVLHQILEIDNECFLIGNAAGRSDDWVSAKDIFGLVTDVQST